MIYVQKENGKFPFSRGILARALAPTGIPIERIYEMISEIREDLRSSGIDVIDSKNLRKKVRKKLHEYGYGRLEKYYLASRQVAKLEKPVIVLIGGASGVGKSAVSAEIGRRYGIERFIGTDLIREIMRYMMPKEINPILHESTFCADSSIINPSVEDEVIYSFYEQSRIVCKGVDAYIRRIVKEGLKTIINGVHLIPGLIKAAEEHAGSIHLYHYVLYIEDAEEHKHRFHLRAEGTRRDPERYIGSLGKIRRIQDYYIEAAEQEKVQTVENSDFEETVEKIFKDITQRLGGEIDER